MCCSLDRLCETLYAYRENPDDPSAQLDAHRLAKRLLHGTAHDDPQTHARQVANDQAAAADAHARSAAPNWKMATVGRSRSLQLLRGTRKPREPGGVSGSGACAVLAYSAPPEPEAPALMDAYPRFGFAMASSTEHAPSLSGCPFCRYSSEIRTGCANERPSGSEEGVVSNHDPYSDRQQRLRPIGLGAGAPSVFPRNEGC
jgi:hypothetical protein